MYIAGVCRRGAAVVAYSRYVMKRKILLVDDDATVLLTLKAVLELNHFDVQTASRRPKPSRN